MVLRPLARLRAEPLEHRILLAADASQLLASTAVITGAEYRSLDGTGNNLTLDEQGAALTRVIRFGYPARYPDGHGDTIDVGDRTLHLVRPPVYDSGTTRGLFDPTTRVYWGSDAFASPMSPVPVRHVADIDPAAWVEGIHTFARYVSPWLELVDDRRYQRTVDRIEALQPLVLAGCHTPGIDGSFVADVLAETRKAPTAEVPPQPDQSVLDALQAALEPAA